MPTKCHICNSVYANVNEKCTNILSHIKSHATKNHQVYALKTTLDNTLICPCTYMAAAFHIHLTLQFYCSLLIHHTFMHITVQKQTATFFAMPLPCMCLQQICHQMPHIFPHIQMN